MHQRPYEKLVVWQEAYRLSLSTHHLTLRFPSAERFRLVDQMCRASRSVPANIAEGSYKKSAKERFKFYETALCSLEELHLHFRMAKDFSYISDEIFKKADDHIQRVSYLLTKLMHSLPLPRSHRLLR